MAPESWLIKVKAAISNSLQSPATKAKLPKKKSVGILAFETAGLMSKLLHLSQSISNNSHNNNSNTALRLLRGSGESTSLQGVRKLVSADDVFLLALARAEAVETLRIVAKSAARIGERCADPNLRDFHRLFEDFANSGEDPHGWAMNTKKELDENKRMDRYVATTAALYREMTDLSSSEGALRRSPPSPLSVAALTAKDQQRAFDLQQKVSLQKQKIRVLKQKSLWKRSFDTVAAMLARSIFTILVRIKRVYGLGHPNSPPSLARSLSASAAVYPSENHNPNPNPSAVSESTSGPLAMAMAMADQRSKPEATRLGFLESNSKLLKPPASALGASGLAIHYASLIIVMEKMIRSPPQMIGVGARDELYGMLPWSLRSALRERLRGVAVCSAGDARLAGEWRDALDRILGWLSPLAHNMVRWQGERSFERQSLVSGRTGVLMLQTLAFADRTKTEAAITELLVGLNYVWRFEREMTAKALFGCCRC